MQSQEALCLYFEQTECGPGGSSSFQESPTQSDDCTASISPSPGRLDTGRAPHSTPRTGTSRCEDFAISWAVDHNVGEDMEETAPSLEVGARQD